MEKIKNLPVMRFVAFAVALAIILGLSSVILSFTVSAEDVVLSDLLVGTIGNYKALRVPISSDVHYVPLSQITAQSGNSSNVAIVGKCNSGYKVFCIFSIVADSNNCTLNGNHFLNDGLFRGSSSNFDNFALQIWSSQSNGYRNLFYQLSYKLDGADNYSAYVGWNGSLSDKFTFTDYYFIFGSYSNDSSEFVNDIENNISSDTDFKDSSDSTSPKAEFVTCASYKTDDDSIPLWFKDFTSEGQQYPLFTYYIHDNGNKHSYSLKLSYSSSAKEDVKKVFNLRENTPADSDSATKDLIERIIALFAIKGVKIHDLSPYIRTSLNLKFPNNLTYNQAFVLSSPEMDFTVTGNNKVFTICLSDYSDILQCLIYKAEIIDNNTGLVLDTTYFASKQTYNKGNSGFGSKIYDYSDNYDDMIGDIKNNTPSVQPVKKDSFISDGDVINTTKYDYYSGLKIDDIFGSLQSSVSSLGSFFQACMSIIPAGILAVIIGGLSIVIVLRILGR